MEIVLANQRKLSLKHIVFKIFFDQNIYLRYSYNIFITSLNTCYYIYNYQDVHAISMLELWTISYTGEGHYRYKVEQNLMGLAFLLTTWRLLDHIN